VDYEVHISECCRWSNVSSDRFDLVLTNEDGDIIKIKHYALTIAHDSVTRQPFHLPVLRSETDFSGLNWHDSSVYKSVWTGSRQLIFFAFDNGRGRVLASLLRTSNTAGSTMAGPLWTGRSGERWNFEICPFSGRLCMLTYGTDYLDIRVMDYLIPMTSR
jgi:hypothetical protein